MLSKSCRIQFVRESLRHSWLKCRLCLSRSSTVPKQGCGKRSPFKSQPRLTRCWQSCHCPRPKFIVRCLPWRWPSMFANCLERNIFGGCKKTACCFFDAHDLLDRRKRLNRNASKKIPGDRRVTRKGQHDQQVSRQRLCGESFAGPRERSAEEQAWCGYQAQLRAGL